MTPQEVLATIEQAVSPETPEGQTYDGTARFAAQRILAAARRDPETFGRALDAYRQNPYCSDIDALLTEDDREIIMTGRWGVTGFQWGWAVQTVAWLLEQPSVPNGAILTIGGAS